MRKGLTLWQQCNAIILSETLKQLNGSADQAALVLGLSRKSIYNMKKRFGIKDTKKPD